MIGVKGATQKQSGPRSASSHMIDATGRIRMRAAIEDVIDRRLFASNRVQGDRSVGGKMLRSLRPGSPAMRTGGEDFGGTVPIAFLDMGRLLPEPDLLGYRGTRVLRAGNFGRATLFDDLSFGDAKPCVMWRERDRRAPCGRYFFKPRCAATPRIFARALVRE